MRIKQDTVNYKLEMEQTLVYVQYKVNICRTWDINYSDYNSNYYS